MIIIYLITYSSIKRIDGPQKRSSVNSWRYYERENKILKQKERINSFTDGWWVGKSNESTKWTSF